jgi:hypothetical protein
VTGEPTKLSKLVALANRPGYESEGAAARAAAEKIAAEHGLELVETRSGELIVVDEFHADLLRGLLEIADPTVKPPAKEIS